MIIRDVQEYFLRNRQGTLSDIAKELGEEEAMVKEAVDFWIQKGRLERINDSGESCRSCSEASFGCGSCRFMGGLGMMSPDIYQWRE